MTRTKIRNYPSIESYKKDMKKWLQTHKPEIENLLLKTFGYEDIEQLKEDDYHMKWGFDCGWVELYPKNPEMEREWKLDNGQYGAYIHDIGFYGFNTQSITLKEPIVEYMLKEMDLENDFIVDAQLD